jgi:hypothetical protein
MIFFESKPPNCLIPNQDDKVLADTGLFVVGFLGLQVDRGRTIRDLRHELRCAVDDLSLVNCCLPTVLRFDNQKGIGLGFTLVTENIGCVVSNHGHNRIVGVGTEPPDKLRVVLAVAKRDGRGHDVHNTPDELGLESFWSLHVERLEGFLVHARAILQLGNSRSLRGRPSAPSLDR